MKSIVTSIVASSLLAALAMAQPPRYTVTDLGTLPGGTYSQPFVITNNGLVSGTASPPDGTQHAVLWIRGLKLDIGTPGLGGPNSITFGVNEMGQAVGEAETSTSANGEDFCGFQALGLPSSGNTCLPFLWQYGVMTPLPTLGGNNGAANQINDRGEVAGVAETTTRDLACPAPQVFQFKPVIWENGRIHELPTVAGDPDGVAFAINDNGQVAGASGDCTTFNVNSDQTNLLGLHALLWQNGTATDLGNLGGTGPGTEMSLLQSITKVRLLELRTCPTTQPFMASCGPRRQVSPRTSARFPGTFSVPPSALTTEARWLASH